MANKASTGLYFGSFNPIHNGHLLIAEYMLEHAGLSEVWFVVSPQNPLKDSGKLANPDQRLKMVKLAIAGNPRFGVCDIEFSLPIPSYTIHTLQTLSKQHPKRSFELIIGSDSLVDFHRWKDYQQLLDQYTFLVYPRSTNLITQFDHHPSIKKIAAPIIDVSSTYIRQCLIGKKEVRYMLPEPVYQYIVKNGLYGV